MPLNDETLTLLAQKPKNAKTAIIQKLSKQWPLTAMQLYHAIKREYALNISYQAVHKALGQLEDEKIVKKEGAAYELHSNWIHNITEFAQQLNKSYTHTESLDPTKELIRVTFPNWVSMGRFIIYRFEAEFPNPKKKVSLCNWMHVWPSISLSAEEVIQIKEIYEHESHYSICPNNTPLDQYLAGLMEKLNKQCITGIHLPMDHDTVIKGDHIAQIYYPPEFYKQVDTFYSETKDPLKLDLKKIQQIATQETKIQVNILHDPNLADEIRRQTMGYFKEG